MPIVAHEPTAEKGKKDARRHREKQKDAIKKKLPEILSSEQIITRRGRGKVKVPIKGIDIPHFRPAKEGGGGVGSGKGEPGDVIDMRPGEDAPAGSAGQAPGEDYLETEIEIEELIELMFEDVGLPRIEEKTLKALEVEIGFKIEGLRRVGPSSLLSRRDTAKQGMKRFWEFLRALERETGKDELVCFRALKQASGALADALTLLKEELVTEKAEEVEPFPVIVNEDLRYRDIKPNIERQSNALVAVMLDVSGSMSDLKKYLARSMIFWLVEVLRKKYERVEVRFIIYHGEAKLVDEEACFHTKESGGTCAHTAYELLEELIRSEYPLSSWNVYAWHFSDGDDFYPKKVVGKVLDLVNAGVNMIGYAEISPEEESFGSLFRSNTLFYDLAGTLNLVAGEGGGDMAEGSADMPVIATIVRKREDILPVVKAFLRKDRWLS